MMVDSQNPGAGGGPPATSPTSPRRRRFHRQRSLAAHRGGGAGPRALPGSFLAGDRRAGVGKVEVKRGGEPRVTTMDIRRFTSRAPETMREGTSSRYQRLLRAHGGDRLPPRGDVDKFVGDEIVALFAGVAPRRRVSGKWCAPPSRCSTGFRSLPRRAGGGGSPPSASASGSAPATWCAGCHRELKAMQYTVIGAPVNLAARPASPVGAHPPRPPGARCATVSRSASSGPVLGHRPACAQPSVPRTPQRRSRLTPAPWLPDPERPRARMPHRGARGPGSAPPPPPARAPPGRRSQRRDTSARRLPGRALQRPHDSGRRRSSRGTPDRLPHPRDHAAALFDDLVAELHGDCALLSD